MDASNFFRTGAGRGGAGLFGGQRSLKGMPPAEGFKWVKTYFLIEAFQK
ncbi:hypothetical protein J2Z19_003215 [Ensifer adhaerens]|uniref:Uncharacterized protein n=1 Tax=Ensifer adhaerens TaxID=106592 RepID=A0ACC5SXF6_ENSAD|nr:hypothetical protein [Ensifer adhaerens]